MPESNFSYALLFLLKKLVRAGNCQKLRCLGEYRSKLFRNIAWIGCFGLFRNIKVYFNRHKGLCFAGGSKNVSIWINDPSQAAQIDV